jgi:hypothetical protein
MEQFHGGTSGKGINAMAVQRRASPSKKLPPTEAAPVIAKSVTGKNLPLTPRYKNPARNGSQLIFVIFELQVSTSDGTAFALKVCTHPSMS